MVESISAGLLGGSSLMAWNWLITSMPWSKFFSSGFYYFFLGAGWDFFSSSFCFLETMT